MYIKENQQSVLDSLTKNQLETIADIIQQQEAEESWQNYGGDSVLVEDVNTTLDVISNYFRTYDAKSVLE